VLQLTGLILTFNEKENIGRTLEGLRWVSHIIVLDSFSSDETCNIASAYDNVRIVRRSFDSFAGQCNYGLSLVETPWMLSLDADYVCSREFADEILALDDDKEVAGFSVAFRYCVFGYPLRNSIYPDRVILYRRELAAYHDEGHGHRVKVTGRLRSLRNKIDHDDRKPLSRWVISQDAYTRLEARHLLAADPQKLNPQDQLRLKIFCAPPVIFFYLLLGRGLILDGWRGWFYVMQRVVAECLLSLRILTEKHTLEKPGSIAGGAE
jgi:glycosyltransferase involved in cell wall biosynthesis